MLRIEGHLDETRCAAEFLFRYMMARYLCKEGTLSPGALDYLVGEISHGRRVFDEILIFTNAGPRIVNDAKATRLLRRDVQRDDGAMPDMDPAGLAARRRYVWNDAPPAFSTAAPRRARRGQQQQLAYPVREGLRKSGVPEE